MILEQGTLQTREYQKDGKKDVFKSVQFKMSNGIDTFTGEMIGRQAETCPQYAINNQLHVVQGSWSVREYEDKNHEKRYDNRFIITKLV